MMSIPSIREREEAWEGYKRECRTKGRIPMPRGDWNKRFNQVWFRTYDIPSDEKGGKRNG